ncbi:MAG: hypothetical protein KGI73_04520, partial [Patescibacteria group bacterium]|nr:hypothetical protein [Patescibacteria group bacterium]
PHHPVLLGYQQRKWALEHQHEYPALMALLGQIYVDFPGLVVVRGDGYRSYPCAAAVGGRWAEYWRWFRHGFDRGGRVAVSGPDVPVGAGK